MKTGRFAVAGATGGAVTGCDVTGVAGVSTGGSGRGCGAAPSCDGPGPGWRGSGGRLAPFVGCGAKSGFGLGLMPAARRGRSAAPRA
jgi:hypothetical protein